MGRNRAGLLRSAAFAAAALCASGAAADTLADAMVKAYSSHPDLAAARASLRSADESVVQERAAGYGTVNAIGQAGLSSTGGATSRDRGMGLTDRRDTAPMSLSVTGSLPIYSGGAVRYGIDSAKQQVLASRAALLDAEQTVLLDAVTAYEDVRANLQGVELARNNVRVINEQVRAARDRFEVGEVTRTDVAQAEARLAAARSNLASAVGGLAAARQAYLAAIGEMPEELASPPPIPALPESEGAAVAIATAEHPLMVQARHLARQAEYEVKRASAAAEPQVDLNGSVSHTENDALFNNGGVTNNAQVTLRATVPLWTGGATPSRVRAAQAAFQRQTAQIHSIARSLHQQTAVAWSSLEVARASIRSSQQQVRAARIAFEGVREEATLGARTTLDVLDAESELLSARTDLITAQRNEYVAAYTLLAAVGKLTIGHMGLDVEGYDPDAYMVRVDQAPYEWAQDESAAPEGEWSLFDFKP